MPSTEPGRRERKKQATRLHIAETAIRLFLARGFEEVSVAEIAEAADVSKVTVFNYFPAKADMVFELADDRRARPAQAVRDRTPGQSAIEALRDHYFAALDARAEWTALHDGVQEFVRMVWSSPTLLTAFSQRGHEEAEELAAELARAVGEPFVPSPPWGDGSPGAVPGGVTHQVVASAIIAGVQSIIDANVRRMLAGQSADEAEPAARADAERAFALLAGGLGDYARRETG